MVFFSNLFKKNNDNKISEILEYASSWLERFELEDFIAKHPSLTKVYGYIFPERVEIEEHQEYRITKEDNVIHVSFKYTTNQPKFFQK